MCEIQLFLLYLLINDFFKYLFNYKNQTHNVINIISIGKYSHAYRVHEHHASTSILDEFQGWVPPLRYGLDAWCTYKLYICTGESFTTLINLLKRKMKNGVALFKHIHLYLWKSFFPYFMKKKIKVLRLIESNIFINLTNNQSTPL